MKYVLAIMIALLAFAGYDHFSKKQIINKQIYIAKKNEVLIRFKKGAFIESENSISDHEITKVIVYPGRLGDFFDKRCHIYINSKLNTSSMACDFGMASPENFKSNECFDKQGAYEC